MLLPCPKAEPLLFFSRLFVYDLLTIVARFRNGREYTFRSSDTFRPFRWLASFHSLASLSSAELGAVKMLIKVRLVDPIDESAYRDVSMQQHVDEVRRRKVLHIFDSLFYQSRLVPYVQSVNLIERICGIE